jgi:predicted ATPase
MSLKAVEMELSPLTVLIGKNAVGKSAIFKALVAVST